MKKLNPIGSMIGCLIFILLGIYIIKEDPKNELSGWISILIFGFAFFSRLYILICDKKLSKRKKTITKNGITIKATIDEVIKKNGDYYIIALEGENQYILKIICTGGVKKSDITNGITIRKFYDTIPLKLISGKYNNVFRYKGAIHDIIPSIFEQGDNLNVIIDPSDHSIYQILAEEMLEKNISGKKGKAIRENLIKSSLFRDPYKYYLLGFYTSKVEISLLFSMIILFFVIFGIIVKNKILILRGILNLVLYLTIMYKKCKLEGLKELKKKGEKINAKIIEINDDTFYEGGCRIRAINGENTYISPEIYNNMGKYLKKGEYISIFVDPNNPSRYYMDLNSIKNSKSTESKNKNN